MVPPPLDASTRTRVLRLISSDGPITAAEIATRLKLTSPGVRRHIDALAAQGVIVEHEVAQTVPRGRGRPSRAYVISPTGHQGLPSAYDSLAARALHFLAAEAGPQGVERFARRHAEDFTARYAETVASSPTAGARTRALVEALTADGYAATARPVGGGALAGIQLCQGHCPVQHVATEFPVLCEAEREAFSRLLGVHVQRLATLAAGDHVCTTFVPTPPHASTSERPPA